MHARRLLLLSAALAACGAPAPTRPTGADARAPVDASDDVARALDASPPDAEVPAADAPPDDRRPRDVARTDAPDVPDASAGDDVAQDEPPLPPDDVAIEAACPRDEPPGPLTCPSCLAGTWRVYGNVEVNHSGEFVMEVSGCPDRLTCTVAGLARPCFIASGDHLRMYLDGVGYRQLVFGIGCDRMLGGYVTYSGSRAVRAELEARAPAPPPPDGCPGPPEDAGARAERCGPCGARRAAGGADAGACERLTNACGGCDPGLPTPGSSCGAGHYYLCAGADSVTCTIGDAGGLNACGGRSGPLAHAPGEPCGDSFECRYACQGSTSVACVCPAVGDAGAPDAAPPHAATPDA